MDIKEHEAPQYENPPVVTLRETQDGEYRGRYEAEPVKTKKNPKREWQDVLVKAMSITLSLAVIIILILTLPIVNFKEKDGSSRGVSLIYFIRNYKWLGDIEGELDKSKVDVQLNPDIDHENLNDGLDLGPAY